MMFLLLASVYLLPLQEGKTLKNVNVSLVVKDATVSQALSILEKQSEYKFFYGSDQFNTERTITLNFHGDMDSALQLILGKEISYVISGRHIILKKDPLSTPGILDERSGKNLSDSLDSLSPSKATNQ